MTVTAARTRHRSAHAAYLPHLGFAVVVGLVVLLSLVATILVQRPLWESTVSLEVRAVQGRDVESVPERVELTAPAVVEAARSRNVVEAAIAKSGVDRSVEEVKRAVTIDVITNVGSATLSVRDRSPVVARRLALAIGREILGLGLLEPQGRLVVVSPAESVYQVAPRRALGGVMALGAALAAGLAAGFMSARFGSRIRGTGDLASTASRHGIAVVDGRSDAATAVSQDPVLRLGRHIGGPPEVAVREVGDVDPDDAAEIASRLTAGASVGPRPGPGTVVLLATRGTPVHLVDAATAIATESGQHVSAVVVL